MSVTSNITDPATGLKACVLDGDYPHGLVVVTRPLVAYENATKFFTSDSAGINMNIDAGTSGTPEEIHNGTDTTLWTATDIVGGKKTTFNSTDQAYEGNLSIKVDNSPVDDVFQLANITPVDMNNYVSFTMWIYVDKNWLVGDDIQLYCWDTTANTQVGLSISLQDYFSYADYDIWHKVTIPLYAFGEASASTLVDSFRVRIVASDGRRPKFYLNTIQLEESGTPVEFKVEADKSTWLHVDSFTISVANNIDSSLLNASMMNLSYDTLLGEVLISGINYRREQSGNILFSATILNLMDLLQQPDTIITGSGYDGTNTWLTIKLSISEPILLKDDDSLIFTINDDLSGLLHLRISAAGRVEER